MKPIPDDLYKKFVSVSNEVNNRLRRQGIVVPTTNNDGTVRVGSFSIVKQDGGFYSIVSSANDQVVKNINLPQTAILVANNLALGNIIDRAIIDTDKNYGYALFEEQLHKRSLERAKTEDRANIMSIKCGISKQKKDLFKRDIVRSFEKLRKLA